MEMKSEEQMRERVSKDIRMFYQNMGKVSSFGSDKRILKVVEMAKMYASDARSYMEKGDMYTAFSCISYAHGLLDAIIALGTQ